MGWTSITYYCINMKYSVHTKYICNRFKEMLRASPCYCAVRISLSSTVPRLISFTSCTHVGQLWTTFTSIYDVFINTELSSKQRWIIKKPIGKIPKKQNETWNETDQTFKLKLHLILAFSARSTREWEAPNHISQYNENNVELPVNHFRRGVQTPPVHQ